MMITERIQFKDGRNVAILRVWRDDGTWSDVEIGRFHDHRNARSALKWAIEELRTNGGFKIPNHGVYSEV